MERLRAQRFMAEDARALAQELGEHIKARLPAGYTFLLLLDRPEARAYSSNLDSVQVIRVTREFLLAVGGVE